MKKPYNRPAGVGNAFPLARFAGLPPQFGGAAKGKRLNGQARRLTSPHWTSTGDYKAPLCCELLMKGLLFRALLSHRSAGGRWCRKAPKGGKPPEVADRRNAYHAYDIESQSRNADFMFIARKGDTTTLGPKGRQTYEPSGP